VTTVIVIIIRKKIVETCNKRNTQRKNLKPNWSYKIDYEFHTSAVVGKTNLRIEQVVDITVRNGRELTACLLGLKFGKKRTANVA